MQYLLPVPRDDADDVSRTEPRSIAAMMVREVSALQRPSNYGWFPMRVSKFIIRRRCRIRIRVKFKSVELKSGSKLFGKLPFRCFSMSTVTPVDFEFHLYYADTSVNFGKHLDLRMLSHLGLVAFFGLFNWVVVDFDTKS